MAPFYFILTMLIVSLAFAARQEIVGDLFPTSTPRTRITFKQGYSFTHYDGKAYIFGGSDGTGDSIFSLANSSISSPPHSDGYLSFSVFAVAFGVCQLQNTQQSTDQIPHY